MNIYFLKKFRKEAYEKYGVVSFENTDGKEVWNVGMRETLKPNYGCDASHFYREGDAIRYLITYRRRYISQRVAQLKYNKRLRERTIKNKQLAKL